MTNGVAVGPQQATGLSDISAQVQQYQQFLGEGSPHSGAGPRAGCAAPREPADGSVAFLEPHHPKLVMGELGSQVVPT